MVPMKNLPGRRPVFGNKEMDHQGVSILFQLQDRLLGEFEKYLVTDDGSTPLFSIGSPMRVKVCGG
jgi:hypothetical protein